MMRERLVTEANEDIPNSVISHLGGKYSSRR